MVNNTIVSLYQENSPPQNGASREITCGPLYPPQDVLTLLDSTGDDAIVAWTNKCQRDMQRWSLDDNDAREILELGMHTGQFRGSEWCQQNPNGPWAACDAYVVSRLEWIQYARKDMNIEYYIKFAIAMTGKVFLLVSCHPVEDRR